MAFDFAATTDGMILAGALEAYTDTVTPGTPNGSRYLYGTAYLSNSDYGIVVSCNVQTTGEKGKIIGAGGVSIARFIVDPGRSGTISVLFAKDAAMPKQGELLTLALPPAASGGGSNVTTYFWVMDFSVKWERQGFRMIDITVERDEAMFTGTSDLFSYFVKHNAALGSLIDSLV